MRTKWIPAAVLLALASVSFAQQRMTTSTAEQHIRAADMAWAKAAAAKNLNATVGFYTDDAMLLFQGIPAIKGKAGIRNQWVQEFADKNYSLTWHPEAIEVSGDLGYSRGIYDAKYTGPSGKGKSEHGKYLAIWKKVGGQWKVAVDMYNSDLE
jgi:ketosteroid isomerase-like protein